VCLRIHIEMYHLITRVDGNFSWFNPKGLAKGVRALVFVVVHEI
jgi:hypothetical protein